MNREKAIEYIRWYFTEDDGMAADASVKEAIQALVPELKESEDERIRKSLIKHFENYYEMYDKTCGEPKFGDDKLIVRDIISYLEKQKEQKPAGLSKEDEENFKWFDKFFRAESILVGGRDIPQDKYLWFKSLRPQPKSEWSEEDRKMIDHLIEALPTWAKGRIAMLPSQADEYVKRLKSLLSRFE